MDPGAAKRRRGDRKTGISVEAVRTAAKILAFERDRRTRPRRWRRRLLTNEAIEQVIVGPLTLDRLDEGNPVSIQAHHNSASEIGRRGAGENEPRAQLSLSLEELQSIQKHFLDQRRDPTDAELETLAQTWSEHCCHKTLTGRIAYRGPIGAHGDHIGQHYFENLLEETIFAATRKIRAGWQQHGYEDWCVSVFEDHAGIVRFDDEHQSGLQS